MTGPEGPHAACRDPRFVRSVVIGVSAAWRCVGCGLGQTVPRPPKADGREWFSGNLAYHAEAYGQPKDRWWYRYTEALLDLLKWAGAGPGLRLLDVGCNLGYLVAAARNHGYEAIGIDGSPAAVALGRELLGLNLICALRRSQVLDHAALVRRIAPATTGGRP